MIQCLILAPIGLISQVHTVSQLRSIHDILLRQSCIAKDIFPIFVLLWYHGFIIFLPIDNF